MVIVVCVASDAYETEKGLGQNLTGRFHYNKDNWDNIQALNY